MRITILLLLSVVLLASCGSAPVDDFKPDTIIALERHALDLWGQGEPSGYSALYAPEITYFDPTQERRIEGIDAMNALYQPIKGKIHVDHYDMLGPKVQHSGATAVLSYNLISYMKPPNAPEFNVRWNCTEVYRQINGQWKIVHNHWSFIQPILKNPISE
ncbi:MAG: nuclear transport factor 2 family protein [Acidobacteriota bacterium]